MKYLFPNEIEFSANKQKLEKIFNEFNEYELYQMINDEYDQAVKRGDKNNGKGVEYANAYIEGFDDAIKYFQKEIIRKITNET